MPPNPSSPHTAPSFVHLHCHSHFSFLNGASSPDALAERAATQGFSALALTDHGSVFGAVKFADACKRHGVAPIFGVELSIVPETVKGAHACGAKGGKIERVEPHHLTLLAENRVGYANICRLITQAHAHGGRLSPCLPLSALADQVAGIICLTGCLRRGPLATAVQAHDFDAAQTAALRLKDIFGRDRLFVELQDDLTPQSRRVSRDLADFAEAVDLPVVATNNVHHADADGFVVHDVLCAIRTGTTVNAVHGARPLNTERRLKSAGEMADLFAWRPDACANTLRIAERCSPDALPLGDDLTPKHAALDAAEHLRHLAYQGAGQRYRHGVTSPIRARLDQELTVICDMGFADYLLLCHDIVAWARSENIRCAGRGSAADSLVAYCLHLTEVEPLSRDLPFERFLHKGKSGPDVDIDWPSDRRDDVFLHLQRTYGGDRVALVGAFHTYQAKGAVRDVGKALGVPPEPLSFLSRNLSAFIRANEIDAAFAHLPELRAYDHLRDRFQLLFEICGRIANFPRHFGSHPSGVVISRVPLTDYAPLIPSAKGVLPIWAAGDMDDAERLGSLKHDLLALRMLSAVVDAERNIQQTEDCAFRYDDIPLGDSKTFDLLGRGQTIGVFQYESAAQISLKRRSPPQDQKDLEADVALIRPGPIRGDVVNRFVARRNGWEDVSFLHPTLASILSETHGLVVFQEQVDQVLSAMMGCSIEDAERFRKRLGKHERAGTMDEARSEFLNRALVTHPTDLTEENARAVFHELEGWSGYGFLHGHAAAFALHGYRTAFLSAHHAASFFAALLSNQPMGWWPPNSLAAEARRRGAQILGVDINASGAKSIADADGHLRLGLNLVAGLGDVAGQIEAERGANGAYRSLLDLCARVCPAITLDRAEALVLSGALDALHPESRRGLLLRLSETLGLAVALRHDQVGKGATLPFLGAAELPATPCALRVPEFDEWDRMLSEWTITGVCAPYHPVAPFRPQLVSRGIMTSTEAQCQRRGTAVRVAGLVIRPHRPPTRSGRKVLFVDIEDESGTVPCICADDEVLERCSGTLLLSGAVIVEGATERRDGVSSLTITGVKALRLWRS